MSPLTPQIADAQRAYDLARGGGASAETVIQAGRELTAAQQAAEGLDERALRLGIAAADKDAEAERHWAAEADAAGRAAGRRFHGNDDDLAASFDREVAACRKLALEAESEAGRLRSQANAIRRSQRYVEDYMAIVSPAIAKVA